MWSIRTYQSLTHTHSHTDPHKHSSILTSITLHIYCTDRYGVISRLYTHTHTYTHSALFYKTTYTCTFTHTSMQFVHTHTPALLETNPGIGLPFSSRQLL